LDIANSYEINHNKIDVACNGANELYKPLCALDIEKIRLSIANGKPYFVFVGAFNPRKNLERLLLAFDIFKEKSQSDFKLIIVGDKMYGTSSMLKTLSSLKYRKDVVFTGRLQVDELCKVIGAAYAMTFVSYYEGFGIPLLEAMRCDVPLVVSNCTSIPEVAGDAAIYVDPFSVDSISDGMGRIYSDELLRKELISKARLQRKRFSWDITAKVLYESIMKSVVKD
jgi:glycosyltransferase involved in cell wall biosynthesis